MTDELQPVTIWSQRAFVRNDVIHVRVKDLPGDAMCGQTWLEEIPDWMAVIADHGRISVPPELIVCIECERAAHESWMRP